MKQELIYISKVKVAVLKELDDFFVGDFSEKINGKIKNIESIGKPFSIITKHCFDDVLSVHYQPNLIFKELMNCISLEKYLRKAEINFSWAESRKKQYLGLIHGDPENISSSTRISEEYSLRSEKCIIPCQFYLIKDKFE